MPPVASNASRGPLGVDSSTISCSSCSSGFFLLFSCNMSAICSLLCKLCKRVRATARDNTFQRRESGVIRRDPIDRVQQGQGSPRQFDPPPTPWDAINRVPTTVLFPSLDFWLNRFCEIYCPLRVPWFLPLR